jgi:chromosome segregation ATPase
MGPVDDMWFERRSGVKIPPVPNGKQESVLRDAYEQKRLESLEKENTELKDIISRMSREMQDVRDSFSQKMDLKDREIKLNKDETYMLKDRINEKEQEVYRYRDRLNQSEVEIARLQERCRNIKETEEQYKDTKEALDMVEHELRRIREEVVDIQQ